MPITRFVPDVTVIGRSVDVRSVRHGTPRTVVSSWTPPESVSTTLGAGDQPDEVEVAERPGVDDARLAREDPVDAGRLGACARPRMEREDDRNEAADDDDRAEHAIRASPGRRRSRGGGA